MTSRALARGHGAHGVIAYIAHDEPTADVPRPTTYARVGDRVALRGMPDYDPSQDREEQLRLAGRILQNNIVDARALKRLSGISAGGRKLKNGIHHSSLSWPEGAQPTWEEMVTAGDSWLKAQRLQGHRVVMTGHIEAGKPAHLHIVHCSVSPITGVAHQGNIALVGSRWAQRWEKDHGGIVIQTRVERNALRDELAVVKAEAQKDPTRHKELERKRQEIRARMPATEPTRSSGGRSQVDPADRAAWIVLYARQRRERQQPRPKTRTGRRTHDQRRADLDRQHDREKSALGQLQRQRRLLRLTAAPSRHLAPIVDNLVDGPPRKPLLIAPAGTLGRVEQAAALVDTYQHRANPTRGLPEAQRVVIAANVARHVTQKTDVWHACENASLRLGPADRRALGSHLSRTSGTDGKILAAMIGTTPPAPKSDPTKAGHFVLYELMAPQLRTRLRSESHGSAPGPTTVRLSRSHQTTIAGAHDAERQAVDGDNKHEKRRMDQFERNAERQEMLRDVVADTFAASRRAAAATGRGLLGVVRATGWVLTAPIWIAANALADVMVPGHSDPPREAPTASWRTERSTRPARPPAPPQTRHTTIGRIARPQAPSPSRTRSGDRDDPTHQRGQSR